MACLLIVYGIVLAGLGFAVPKTHPPVGQASWIPGLAGGGLSLLWGVAALAGLKRRVWAILTATGTALVLLVRSVHLWMASSGEDAASLNVRLLVTTMFVLTVGMLMYLVHGERPPEFYRTHNVGGARKAP